MSNMKESIDVNIMRNTLSMYVLTPSAYLRENTEEIVKIYNDMEEESVKNKLGKIIKNNQTIFLSDLSRAVIFDQEKKLNLNIWIEYAKSFDLTYIHVLSHVFKNRRNIEDLMSKFIFDNTSSDDLVLFLKLSIKDFNFRVIEYLILHILKYKHEEVENIKFVFSKCAVNQRNFLNLLLANYIDKSHSNVILNFMNINDFNFDTIINLQNSRKNNEVPIIEYEKNRFNYRFSALIESSLFDKDEVIVKKLEIIPEYEFGSKNTISYIYSNLNYENDKKLLIEIVKNRISGNS